MVSSRGFVLGVSLIGAALSLLSCVDQHADSAVAQTEVGTSLDDGYDYSTPCGTDGGPSCLVGWCMNASDACSPELIGVCDPLFLATACEPPGLPPPPLDTCTIATGSDDTMAPPPGGPIEHDAVVLAAGDAQDMTGWVDPLGDSGKVKIETADGSINAKYEVVKKTKDEIEIKISGGGFTADFDPKDPLVIRLYNACGKQKYSTTGTVRIIGGKRVSLKAGPDDVDVSKGGGGVITIKKDGQEIKITPKGGGNGATLDGGGAKMDFTK